MHVHQCCEKSQYVRHENRWGWQNIKSEVAEVNSPPLGDTGHCGRATAPPHRSEDVSWHVNIPTGLLDTRDADSTRNHKERTNYMHSPRLAGGSTWEPSPESGEPGDRKLLPLLLAMEWELPISLAEDRGDEASAEEAGSTADRKTGCNGREQTIAASGTCARHHFGPMSFHWKQEPISYKPLQRESSHDR